MQFLLFLSLLISTAFAVRQTHEISPGKKITIELPEKWESVTDLYGIPLTVLGPWNDESRPAMSFVYTGMDIKKFPESELQKLFKDFKSEKESWVKEHKGELLKYEPVKKIIVGKNTANFIGAEFKINGIHFIERSYYLTCKDEVYNLKYNIRHEHLKHLQAIMGIVETFKCE